MLKHSNNNISGPVFLIMTGFNCNNNCVMCSVRPKGLHYVPRSSAEIIKDLKHGRELKYVRVEFTGGEPTMREDLLKLISNAKKLGYAEIALSTNGRKLSSLEYLGSLQKHGLNRVTSTLYSSQEAIHDSITRVPGSFKQTIKGIQNAVTLEIITSVNTVVFNKTVNGLQRTGKFIASLGVKYWAILDLIPDGYAATNYETLIAKPQSLHLAFRSLRPALLLFNVVSFFDFPYCSFPNTLLESPVANIITAKGRVDTINTVGYNPNRFQKKHEIYYDLHKERLLKCVECAYNKECGGIWNVHNTLYEGKFLKPFKAKITKL